MYVYICTYIYIYIMYVGMYTNNDYTFHSEASVASRRSRRPQDVTVTVTPASPESEPPAASRTDEDAAWVVGA